MAIQNFDNDKLEVNKLSAGNQETTSSTQMLNSQNTVEVKSVPLYSDVFAKGAHHIN